MADDLRAELEELDALLDPEGALEAEFQALERGRGAPGAGDPLGAMKRAMAGEGADAPLLVLLACPRCGRKNRTPLDKLRRAVPRCGACGAALGFTR